MRTGALVVCRAVAAAGPGRPGRSGLVLLLLLGVVAGQHLGELVGAGHDGGGVEPSRLAGQPLDRAGDGDGRDDATARAYLPIRDGASTYSDNGYLTVHGWLDDETVLAWVQPRVSRQMVGEEWFLVAWHYPSGELTRLAGGDAYARLADVVPSLLER